MTGYLTKEELPQDIKLDEFLLKPFTLETIATVVNKIIPITATQDNDGSDASPDHKQDPSDNSPKSSVEHPYGS